MPERRPGLITDLYELTMAAAYFENGLNHRADFELFVRSLPPGRSFLITAGLEQAIDYLSSFALTSADVDYLREHPSFGKVSSEFFEYLRGIRFTGDVWAMPEGAVAFGMEPLLRVSAPIIEAQIVETFLLATINFQTMIASKAARIVAAARGRSVVDFGTRRAHGPEAGLFAARSSYIGGCDGTSNVEAGALFGIPTLGTLAHAFIMAFEKEEDAFRVFLNTFPETATLLVDTYDTIAAVELIAQELHQTPSVRLDSGDILELSRKVRSILDRAGMTQTKIFASGDLNEYRIAELVEGGAEIDGFGVGTELATSYDAPALSGVYKLVSYETEGSVKMRIKLSPEKATYPGAKQVWRYFDESGTYTHDLITAADDDSRQSDERPERALPLLQQVMTEGRRLDESLTPKEVVDRARARASEEIKRMPEYLKRIERSYPDKYPVRVSERLESLRARVAQDLKYGS